jgi:hypothetical protein
LRAAVFLFGAAFLGRAAAFLRIVAIQYLRINPFTAMCGAPYVAVDVNDANGPLVLPTHR